MAAALKILCALLLLQLAGCHRTQVPDSYYNRDSSAKGYSVYTVRRGDTLYSIGRRFGVDYRLLARRNRIRRPYTIHVGQHIYLTRTAPRSTDLPVSHSAARGDAPPKGNGAGGANGGHASVVLRWPVAGKVTSRFGRRGSRMHDGIDIAAPAGTPVYAAAGGEVVYSDQRLHGYGKLIIIRHAHDVFTAYAHNQRNLVRKGARVQAGDVIARVGNTGRATGSHLHFEVRRGSTPVDPLAYLPARR